MATEMTSIDIEKNKEQASDAAGKAGEAKSHLGHAKTFARSAMNTVTSPVAGPCWMHVIYVFLVGGAFCFFIYTLADAGRTITEPVTSVAMAFEPELEYPDIYMCLPAFAVESIYKPTNAFSLNGFNIDKKGNERCHGAAFTNSVTQGYANKCFPAAVSDEAMVSGTNFYREDKRCHGFRADPYDTPATMCGDDENPYSNDDEELCLRGPFNKKITANDDGTFTACKGDDKSPWVINERATTLAKLMPKYKHDDGREDLAKCFYFDMKATKTHYTSAASILVPFAWRAVRDTLISPVFMWSFFTPHGSTPYASLPDGEKYINSSKVFTPLSNTIVDIGLTQDMIKDEVKNGGVSAGTATADDQYFSSWTASSSPNPLKVSMYWSDTKANKPASDHTAGDQVQEDMIGGYAVFHYTTHVVRKVHVRFKTPSEIWSLLGGLYAGALAVVGLFFSASGHLSAKKEGDKNPQKVVQVFNFLPGKYKKKYLDGLEKDMSPEEKMMARLEALESSNAKLEARLAASGSEQMQTPQEPNSEI